MSTEHHVLPALAPQLVLRRREAGQHLRLLLPVVAVGLDDGRLPHAHLGRLLEEQVCDPRARRVGHRHRLAVVRRQEGRHQVLVHVDGAARDALAELRKIERRDVRLLGVDVAALDLLDRLRAQEVPAALRDRELRLEGDLVLAARALVAGDLRLLREEPLADHLGARRLLRARLASPRGRGRPSAPPTSCTSSAGWGCRCGAPCAGWGAASSAASRGTRRAPPASPGRPRAPS